MNYEPIFDAVGTALLVALLAVALFDLALTFWMGRKARELYRRGAMWGGE